MNVTTATPLLDAPRREIRRTRRGDEKSEQIRSTATELFLGRGYDGVSVDEIVRAVGENDLRMPLAYEGKGPPHCADVDRLPEPIEYEYLSIEHKYGALGARKFARKLAMVGHRVNWSGHLLQVLCLGLLKAPSHGFWLAPTPGAVLRSHAV